MQKKKRIYWLTHPGSAQVQQLDNELRHHGYHCDFFSSIDGLMSAIAARRTTIIVLGNLGSTEKEVSALKYLAQRPELQGVRFVLAPAKIDVNTLVLAAAFNFRDIIPIDFHEKLWVERFIFATSTNPTPLTQSPAMVGFNQLATIHVPTRVVWISRDQIWLESRLEAPPGTTISLRGGLAEAVGLSSIKMEVLGSRKKFLFYRFSNALICQWHAPEKFQKAILHILKDMLKAGSRPICRVFMAVETSELRNNLIDALPSPSFKLTAALQKKGIPVEPRYFSPNVVLIEDKLVTSDGGAQFADLMNNIEPTTPVLILGENVDLAAITRNFHHRPVFNLPQKAPVIREAIRSRFFQNIAKIEEFDQQDLVYLSPDHALSFAEVSVPARLTRIHPLRGTISTAHPVGQFALTQIESPVLNKLFSRPIFAKLTSSYKNPHPDHPLHPYVADFSISDLSKQERARLAEALPQFVSDQMKSFEDDRNTSSIPRIEAQIRPEVDNLGSQQSHIKKSNPKSLKKAKAPATKSNQPERDPAFSFRDLSNLLVEILQDQKKKFQRDPAFRIGVQAVMAIAMLVGALFVLVKIYEPLGRQSGKVWSDSFKQYRDRQRP